MHKPTYVHYHFFILLITTLLTTLSGCSQNPPAHKPETGPLGSNVVTHTNPPFYQRFEKPPSELYDIETAAGAIFGEMIKQDWPKAEAKISELSQLWLHTKNLTGDKKGVKESDEALNKLAIAVKDKNSTDAHAALNTFMSSISDIGKSYKLSPVSDIIVINNALRNVSFYVANKDWEQSEAKAKELSSSWSALKPNLEQIGILSEVTTAHSLVTQIKDSVSAKNNGAFIEQSAKLNESMGLISDFFRGK